MFLFNLFLVSLVVAIFIMNVTQFFRFKRIRKTRVTKNQPIEIRRKIQRQRQLELERQQTLFSVVNILLCIVIILVLISVLQLEIQHNRLLEELYAIMDGQK